MAFLGISKSGLRKGVKMGGVEDGIDIALLVFPFRSPQGHIRRTNEAERCRIFDTFCVFFGAVAQNSLPR